MLRIHEELKAGALTNCTKLARGFGVSTKTMMRDIAFMRDRLDLPLEYDPQIYAWRYSYPVDNFPTVQITAGELLALMVARKALEQYRGTPYHHQLEQAFEKLSAGVRDKVSFAPTGDDLAVSFYNLGLGKADMKVFEGLSRAVTGHTEVTFDYRKVGETSVSHRRVRPYHLANRENLWYLVGFDIGRGAVRQFALTRLSNIALLRVSFERPRDFSPERFFAKSFGAFTGAGNHKVRIRFSSAVADRIRERGWHESQETRDLAGGGLELSLRLGDLAEVERWVLGWGGEAEVLEPAELRERLRQVGRRLCTIYGG